MYARPHYIFFKLVVLPENDLKLSKLTFTPNTRLGCKERLIFHCIPSPTLTLTGNLHEREREREREKT